MEELQQSNRNIHKRVALKLGDPALIHGFINSPVWKMLFPKFGEAILFLLKRFVRANSAIIAYLLTAIKAGHHGVLVCGIVLTIMGSSMMAVYNSSYVWSFLDSLRTFSLPELPAWEHLEWYEIAYDFLYVNTESFALIIYNCVFVFCSLFHTLQNWFGYGTSKITKRGTSYLYLLLDKLLSKWVAVGEFFVNFLETVLVGGIGILLVRYNLDAHFGYLLISMAINELIILITDKTAQLHNRTLLNI